MIDVERKSMGFFLTRVTNVSNFKEAKSLELPPGVRGLRWHYWAWRRVTINRKEAKA